MDIKERLIRTYRTPSGREPFVEWLKGLKDRKARAIVHTRIARLKVGNFGDYKRIDTQLFELRIHYGSGYRVYFGMDGDEVILLLCGGTKKTQRRDIDQAKSYWDEYRSMSYV